VSLAECVNYAKHFNRFWKSPLAPLYFAIINHEDDENSSQLRTNN